MTRTYECCPACGWAVDYSCGCADGRTRFPLITREFPSANGWPPLPQQADGYPQVSAKQNTDSTPEPTPMVRDGDRG